MPLVVREFSLSSSSFTGARPRVSGKTIVRLSTRSCRERRGARRPPHACIARLRRSSSLSWTTSGWWQAPVALRQSTRSWKALCGTTRASESTWANAVVQQGRSFADWLPIHPPGGEGNGSSCDRVARLPNDQQGIIVLGTPLGHEEFVKSQLQRKLQDQSLLLQRIEAVPDLQCARLMLLFCACQGKLFPPSGSPRLFRGVRPATRRRHLASFLAVDQQTRDLASLPCRLGGLGLRSATRGAPAAHWASWADSLPMVDSATLRLQTQSCWPSFGEEVEFTLKQPVSAGSTSKEWGLTRQSGETSLGVCDQGPILSRMTGHECPRQGGNTSLQRLSKPVSWPTPSGPDWTSHIRR